MIRREEAVSEVVGMILILSIMMLVIGIIMTVGLPMIESSKNMAKMNMALNSFLSLQSDIEEVVRGPIWIKDPTQGNDISGLGPSRETEVDLMGGTLNVVSSGTGLTYSQNGNNFDITISSGNITFLTDSNTIVYENGAVISSYDSGMPLMESNPLINIYNTSDNGSSSNITVSMHVININKTVSSIGGEGEAMVETKLKYYNQTIQPAISTNSGRVNISIYSNYPDAWRAFFDEKLKKTLPPANYSISGTKPLVIKINGTRSTSNNDIFLSVYNSTVDIAVR